MDNGAAKAKRIPLIKKTSRIFIGISFTLMVLSSIALYFYVRNMLQEEIEEELFSTLARVETALSNNESTFSLSPLVEVTEVTTMGNQIQKDTLLYDPFQKEIESFRELRSFKQINGKKYSIVVRKFIIDSEDILMAIVFSYITIILLVFVFLFYFNKERNKKLWKPFFNNLEAMKNFSLTSDKPIPLMESEILEFYELNKEITILTDKVRIDYKNLKQFTEDVSHELQNPLAIIQAKIENIINGDNLSDKQFENLTSIQKDIQRLGQMNKRLTLLTKIENNQFVSPEQVDLTDIMKRAVDNFHEISSSKIRFVPNESILVEMDKYLAEILCNNLISNAIKHSPNDREVEIVTKTNLLSVSNNGTTPLEHPEKLFSRFYRESEANKSTGLGLAIVKQICVLYCFEINYNFNQGKHFFAVKVR